jgi:hypothetical protein
MSDESEISQVLDRIGRLKLGRIETVVLAGLALLKWNKKHPVERFIRWTVAISLGLGYWNGLFS